MALELPLLLVGAVAAGEGVGGAEPVLGGVLVAHLDVLPTVGRAGKAEVAAGEGVGDCKPVLGVFLLSHLSKSESLLDYAYFFS